MTRRAHDYGLEGPMRDILGDPDVLARLVTETLAILAKRGTGKSNAAVVFAELMFDGGFPWVAIDPKGDWWGTR
jgi:hypothetical protein